MSKEFKAFSLKDQKFATINRQLQLAFLFLFSCTSLSSENVPNDLIKVLAVEYPPFLSEQSETFGTSFEHLKPYAKKNFTRGYKPFFLPPGRAQLLMQQGNWCVSFYPPRAAHAKIKFVTLAPDNVRLGLYRIKQSNRFYYESLSELSGSVAMMRSNDLGAIHKKVANAGLDLVHLETVEQGIHMLLSGRVDYAFGDNTTLKTYAKIPGIDTLQFSEVPLHETPIGFFYNTDCEASIFKQTPK